MLKQTDAPHCAVNALRGDQLIGWSEGRPLPPGTLRPCTLCLGAAVVPNVLDDCGRLATLATPEGAAQDEPCLGQEAEQIEDDVYRDAASARIGLRLAAEKLLSDL